MVRTRHLYPNANIFHFSGTKLDLVASEIAERPEEKQRDREDQRNTLEDKSLAK
jgi:hypothetical protein